jgi:hypothetical protein
LLTLIKVILLEIGSLIACLQYVAIEVRHPGGHAEPAQKLVSTTPPSIGNETKPSPGNFASSCSMSSRSSAKGPRARPFSAGTGACRCATQRRRERARVEKHKSPNTVRHRSLELIAHIHVPTGSSSRGSAIR